MLKRFLKNVLLIFIIVFCVIGAYGGVLAYQYFSVPKFDYTDPFPEWAANFQENHKVKERCIAEGQIIYLADKRDMIQIYDKKGNELCVVNDEKGKFNQPSEGEVCKATYFLPRSNCQKWYQDTWLDGRADFKYYETE